MGSRKHFQQKLQDLHMSSGLGEILSPSIQPMPAQKEPVRLWVPVERGRKLPSQRGDILPILKKGQPLLVLMGRHAIKPFEHFEAGNTEAALRGESLRENRAPHRMGMQDSARSARANHGQV